jgi:F0F1-type ATP synthase assembly protein I
MTDLLKNTGKNRKADPSWEALSFAWELGYMIAIPAFLFGFGGAYLDKYLGSSPTFLLSGLFLALLTSGIVIYRRLKHIMSSI